jgi:CDP-4-dehydro-6-deoxyglucose reductase
MSPAAQAFPGTCTNAIIQSIVPLSAAVWRLRLSQATNRILRYIEGQYLCVVLPDGDVRPYSIASRSNDAGTLDLHVLVNSDGKFPRFLREHLRPGDALGVCGPLGEAHWRQPDADSEPILLLATGTGIAPINAMIEAMIEGRLGNPVWLYWGSSSEADLYLRAEYESLERLRPNFHFIPVLSAPSAEWSGATGHVQDIAVGDHADLSQAHVYACGAQGMISAARDLFVAAHNLSPAHFYADTF